MSQAEAQPSEESGARKGGYEDDALDQPIVLSGPDDDALGAAGVAAMDYFDDLAGGG